MLLLGIVNLVTILVNFIKHLMNSCYGHMNILATLGNTNNTRIGSVAGTMVMGLGLEGVVVIDCEH